MRCPNALVARFAKTLAARLSEGQITRIVSAFGGAH
jgi:hypothetical protein